MAGWLFRKFLQLLIISFIIILAGAAYVVFFVNPTHFKGQISRMIQSHTGYEIEIRGPVSWAFRPNFAVHVQDVTLVGPKEFKSPFFVAKDAHLHMNFFSMFGSNFVINKIEIDQMIATIQHDASGKHNLENLKTLQTKNEDRLTIKEIAITNSTILYQNEQTQRHLALNNATINLRNIVFNPFASFGPTKIKGDFTQLDYNFSFGIDTTLAIDTIKKTGTLDPLVITWNSAKFEGNATISQYSENPIANGTFSLTTTDLSDFVNAIYPALAVSDTELGGKVEGKFSYTYSTEAKILEIPSYEFVLGDGNAKGHAKVNLNTPYLMEFEVNANKITLVPYFAILKNLLPHALERMKIDNPLQLLKSIGIRGKFAGTELKIIPDFLIDHASADFAVEKGVVQFGPVLLRAFDGAHNFGLNIDINPASPIIKLVEQGNNVQLEPWLKLFNLPRTIVGTAELKVALEGTGFTPQAFLASASGGCDFNVNKGTLYGLDLDKLLAYTTSSINDIMSQLGNNRTADLTKLIKLKSGDWISWQRNVVGTAFDNFQFKNQIKNGATTSSVTMNNAGFDVTGNGRITLSDFNINMVANVTTKVAPASVSVDVAKYIQQEPIAIAVTGKLSNPTYTPDLQTYISKILNQAQKSLMSTAAAKMVAATGPSAPSDKSAEEIFINSLQGLKQ